jgi:quinol monooxygenase YgiN
MPLLQVSSAPSRAVYEAVDNVVGLTSNRPAGMLLHAAAEQADGTVVIVDVWESSDAMDAFERGRLLPAFAAAQRPMADPPTRLEAFQVIRA